jgi:hypothetical protein
MSILSNRFGVVQKRIDGHQGMTFDEAGVKKDELRSGRITRE